MRELKFTPGPWTIYTTKDESGDMPNYHYRIWSFRFGQEAWPVGIGDVDRPLDARLIAAAPDMYEALQKLARLGNGDQYGNSDGNIIARDATAKADGYND